MAKGLNQVQVGLTFTADTGQAKAQLQELKNTINSLYSSTAQKSPVAGLTPKVNDALNAVGKLKTALEQATNVDTGRLDLSKFSQQLQKGGITLKQYANHLTQLGPTGERAFLQLAQSIVTAEVPMRKANAALTEMWTTLKNTARWQLSSSILHGFMGSVQQAYGYAQDLNESLNNIRIVTGQNIDQMARFADQANKAAKALSSTTTEYTNAALIYYQQGLGDTEIEERTAITLKMANVARQSAEIVSDQMTAVWNNFDNGSKSLEYYADVMTALGAATASSTDEIAQGLEKFSAIASTVGLSYEYATSALATVTAETRESADVVGTAFKTIFARAEGLKLGETLEDGTDLNKYSQALATVGVQIKDVSGEMRTMDDILNDLGTRWQTLAQDEKIALAQTVAGVRQYNHLISLMDNWDVMQENLGTAYGSTGALQEQADIYAESWEAAENRATAAAEGIYASLLDDEFFIKLTDTFGNLLEDINKFTKAIGGMPGVLSLVAAVMTRTFGPQIAANVTQFVENFKIMTGQAEQTAAVMRDKTIIALQAFTKDLEMTSASGIETQVMIDQVQHAYSLQEISERINEEHVKEIKELMQIEQQYGNIASTAARSAEEASGAQTKRLQSMRAELVDDAIERGETAEQGRNLAQGVENNFKQFGTVQEMSMRLQEKPKTKTSTLVSELENSGIELYGPLGDAVSKYTEIRDRATFTEEEAIQKQKDLRVAGKAVREEIKHFGSDTEYADGVIQTYAENFKEAHTNIKSSSKTLKEVGKGFVDQAKKAREGENALSNYQERVKITGDTIKKAGDKIVSFGQKFTQSLQGVSSFAIGLTSLNAAIDTLNNPDLSTWEKFSSVLMSMSIGLGSLISGIGSFTKTTGLATAAKILFAAAVENANDKIYEELAAQTAEQIVESQGVTLATATIMSQRAKAMAWLASKESLEELSEEEIKEQLITKAGIAADTAEIIAKNLKSGATLKEAMAEAGLTTAKSTGITARISATGATIAETLAQWGLNAAMAPFVGIMLAAVASMLPYIAAAGAIALVIYGVVKAVNAENEALKEAEEREKRSSENLERIKNEINDVNNSLKNLDNLSSTFKDLEEGSLEWLQALQENREEIEKIKEVYGELEGLGGISVDENGLQYVNDQGKQYISQESQHRFNALSGTNSLVKINKTKTEIDNLSSPTFRRKVDFNKEGASTAEVGHGRITASEIYEQFDLQEIYDRDLSLYYQLGETILKSAADSTTRYQGQPEKADEGEFLLYGDKEFEEYLDGLKEYYEQRLELEKKVEKLEENYYNTKIASIGSNRNYEQSKEIIDNNSNLVGYSVDGKNFTYNKDTVDDEGKIIQESKTFKWQDRDNYAKDEDMPSEVVDFLTLLGKTKDDYVAQRDGELVVKDGDGEKPYSKEEVFELLGEYYSSDDFKSNYADGLRKELTQITDKEVKYTDPYTKEEYEAPKTSYTTLTDDQVINLDNFKLGLDEALGTVDNLNNKVYNSVLNAYGTAEEKLKEFADDTSYLDTSSDKFQQWAAGLDTRFNSSKESAAALKQELKEMNAEAELAQMDSYFADQGNAAGLSEEQIADAQVYAEHLMEIAGSTEEVSKELKTNAKAAADASIKMARMDKGIQALSENFDDWNKILGDDSKKATTDYAKASKQMKTAVSDILNVSEDLIDLDFVTNAENLELIGKAAEGDADAIRDLGIELAKTMAINTVKLTDAFDLNGEELNGQAAIDKVTSLMNEIGNIISSNSYDLGESIDDTNLIDKLNNVVLGSKMTVDQANEYYRAMGFTPEFETTSVEQAESVPITTTYHNRIVKARDEFNQPTDWVDTEYSVTEQVSGGTLVSQMPALKMMTNDGKAPQVQIPKIKSLTYSGGGNYSGGSSSGGSKGGGGGGGSKSKPAEKTKLTKKSDTVERYKEINDALEDVARSMEEANTQADRMFGDERIKAMNKQIQLLEKERKLLQQKAKDAKTYLAQDKKNLNKAASEAGISFKYDQNGNISNYTAEMTKLYEQLNAAETKYNNFSTKEAQDQYSKTTLEPLKEKIATIEEAMKQYEDTLQETEDLAEQTAENIRQELDTKLAAIDYSVEVQIEVNDFKLKVLENLIKKLNDDLWDGEERVANLTKQTDLQLNNLEVNKTGIRQTIISAGGTQEQVDAYMAGDSSVVQDLNFTDEQLNMLKNYTEGVIESEEALLELRESVEGQVMATFDAWHEEIEKNGLAFDHATNMAQSYKDIIDIVGKDSLGIDDSILEELENTQVSAAEGAMANAKVQMETTANALKTAKENLDKAVDEDSKKMWQKTVDQLNEQMMADEQAFMDSWSNALQVAADAFDAKMGRAFDNLEKNLTGVYGSFEELTKSMEQQETVADRFLDSGAKLYELSKLSRSLQKDIDNTSNKKAQQELLDLQKTISDYQADGVQMSKYELEALQKRYELKVAEIALEDAQNAKTAVMRTRDADGNFGYVYSADENKVADAEQNYEDKLEENRQLLQQQSKEMTDSIVQNRQAMLEAMKAVRREDYEDTQAYMDALNEVTVFYKEQEAYLIGEQQKVVARGQELYTEDYLAYEGWSTGKTKLAGQTAADLDAIDSEHASGRISRAGQTAADIGIIESASAADRLKRTEELNAAKKKAEDLADEIEYLQSTGQWDDLSDAQKQAYINELKAAEQEYADLEKAQKEAHTNELGAAQQGYIDLEKAQTDAYGSMGINADGWVTDYGDLMGDLGINMQDYVMNGKTGEAGANGLLDALGDSEAGTGFFGEANKAAGEWEEDFKGIMKQGGVDVDQIKDGTEGLVGDNGAEGDFTTFKGAVLKTLYGEGGTKDNPKEGSVNAGINAAKGKIDTLGSTAKTKFDAVSTSVSTWQSTYSPKITKATTDTNALGQSVASLLDKKIEVIASVTGKTDVDDLAKSIRNLSGKTVTVTTNYQTNYSTTGDKPATSTNKPANNVPEGWLGVTYTVKKGDTLWDIGKAYGIPWQTIYERNKSVIGSNPDLIYPGQVYKFDTGGYTGEWGSEGKLALLHQKELVLNSQDTENFLLATEILRNIINTISLNSLANNLNTNDMMNRFNSNLNGNNIEQHITIHAEFPDATDRNEIEEAFNSLVNRAAQRINKNI